MSKKFKDLKSFSASKCKARFHKKLKSVLLEIKKLERCLKVHRVQRPVSSCACCKVCSLLVKCCFSSTGTLCMTSLGFYEKWLLQAFSSRCLFCSDKELRKVPGNTDEKLPRQKMRSLQDSTDQYSGERGFQIIHGNNQPGGQCSAREVTLCEIPQPWPIYVSTNFCLCI